MISPRKIDRLMEATIDEAAPMRYEPNRRTEMSVWWRDTIGAIDGVRLTTHPGDRDSRSRVLCRFTIPDSRSTDYERRSDELRVEHDRTGQIVLRSAALGSDSRGRALSHAGDVERLVDAVRGEYRTRNAKRDQQDLVVRMKLAAFQAELGKLAEQREWDWTSTVESGMVLVYIRRGEAASRLSEDFQMSFAVDCLTDSLADSITELRVRFDSIATGKCSDVSSDVRPLDELPDGVAWIGLRG